MGDLQQHMEHVKMVCADQEVHIARQDAQGMEQEQQLQNDLASHTDLATLLWKKIAWVRRLVTEDIPHSRGKDTVLQWIDLPVTFQDRQQRVDIPSISGPGPSGPASEPPNNAEAQAKEAEQLPKAKQRTR